MKKFFITAALVVSVAGIAAPVSSAEPDPSGRPGYQPFPGVEYFHKNPNSRIISRMGQRLESVGCGQYYRKGPGPQWTESDRKAYACWQRKLKYRGAAADGWPGKKSWDALRVPYGYE